ncbi:Rnase Y domain-containing protein, partial [Parolsenella catena]|uniref:Rnase Y domain-containing protein n=1 Tax=Parolsenella catena TaxID=2003188 RepID=UPI003AF025E2
MLPIIVAAVIALVAGFAISHFVVNGQNSAKVQEANRQVSEAQQRAEQICADAERQAETTKKEAVLAAKEDILKQRQAAEAEEKQRKSELHSLESRIMQREESLDRRNDALDRREHQLSSQAGQLDRRQSDLDGLVKKQTTELERISSLSQDEAHKELLDRVRKDTVREEAQILRESEQRTRAQADKTAREIVTTAIQRCAADQAGEVTVTSVHIPSDDLKGRIIGREGRNIRTFEQVSGVSLVIDDTPETVLLSSFEPVRRETARVALENLIADGRIHPARIEEMYKKAETLVNQRVQEAGEQAAFDAGIHDLHPE